jgi:hypothetical protein
MIKPELGQIWFLLNNNELVPCYLLEEVRKSVEYDGRLFRAIDLSDCTTFLATENRWTKEWNRHLIGAQIA